MKFLMDNGLRHRDLWYLSVLKAEVYEINQNSIAELRQNFPVACRNLCFQVIQLGVDSIRKLLQLTDGLCEHLL